MSKRSESGEGWEVRRRYISTETAHICAKQAAWLMEQTADCLYHVQSLGKRITTQPLGTVGLKSTTAHLAGSKRNAPYKCADSYPYIEAAAADLIGIFHKMSLDSGDTMNAFSILRYVPFGRLGWHRDEEKKTVADNSLALGLRGVAQVAILEPSGERVNKIVMPGDALYLDNSGLPEMRPAHRVQNITPVARIVIVD